jgi:hypothetical protein
MPEVIRLRVMVDASMRFTRNAFETYPFLKPRDEDAEAWETVLVRDIESEISMTKKVEIDDLVNLLSESDLLRLQAPVKKRIVHALLELIDWRVRAQCLAHNYAEPFRPRPWSGGDQLVRSSQFWTLTAVPGAVDVFECGMEPLSLPASVVQASKAHVVTIAPPKEFIYGSTNLMFFYAIEGVRHLTRVFSDMCELCCNVTTAENDNLFWITCDSCERWFHGPCAALVEVTPSFVCPQCTIASPQSTQGQKTAAMAIIATCASSGPKRMPPPTEMIQRVLAEGKGREVVVLSEPQELAILQRTVQRRTLRQ